MKNHEKCSKKKAKINQKPIKKRARKLMQKWCQKDARPTLPGNPKEGSLLRREHTEKQQTTTTKTTVIAQDGVRKMRWSAEKCVEQLSDHTTAIYPLRA